MFRPIVWPVPPPGTEHLDQSYQSSYLGTPYLPSTTSVLITGQMRFTAIGLAVILRWPQYPPHSFTRPFTLAIMTREGASLSEEALVLLILMLSRDRQISFEHTYCDLPGYKTPLNSPKHSSQPNASVDFAPLEDVKPGFPQRITVHANPFRNPEGSDRGESRQN